jgi:predicted phage-related endonuclease
MPSGPQVAEKPSSSNAYIVLGSADDDREDWLKKRTGLLTASDIPMILGIPKPGSRQELWYRKRDELDQKRKAGYVIEASDLGHRLEDVNAAIFAEKTGRQVERAQELLQSTKWPWLGCTLDYWQTDPDLDTSGPLELKSTGVPEKWPANEDPCMEWMVQVTTQILITGSTLGSLSVLFGNPTFHHRHVDVPLDEELASMIIEETEHFAHLLEANTPPAFTDDVSCYEVIKRLDDRRVAKDVIDLPDEFFELDQELIQLKAQKHEFDAKSRAIKKPIEVLEAKFGAVIGEHEAGRFSNGILYTLKVTKVAPQEGHHYRALKRVIPKAEIKGTRDAPARRRRRR